MKKITLAFLIIFYAIMPYVLQSANNKYIVNIQANSYGIDPNYYEASYDSNNQQVVITPINKDDRDKKIIPRVYARQLQSDPPGHNFIGTVPNPRFNPGFIVEYTSYRPIFELYATKY